MLMYNQCPISLTKAELYQKAMKLEGMMKESGPVRQDRLNGIISELRYKAKRRITPVIGQFMCNGRPVVG